MAQINKIFTGWWMVLRKWIGLVESAFFAAEAFRFRTHAFSFGALWTFNNYSFRTRKSYVFHLFHLVYGALMRFQSFLNLVIVLFPTLCGWQEIVFTRSAFVKCINTLFVKLLGKFRWENLAKALEKKFLRRIFVVF